MATASLPVHSAESNDTHMSVMLAVGALIRYWEQFELSHLALFGC